MWTCHSVYKKKTSPFILQVFVQKQTDNHFINIAIRGLNFKSYKSTSTTEGGTMACYVIMTYK